MNGALAYARASAPRVCRSSSSPRVLIGKAAALDLQFEISHCNRQAGSSPPLNIETLATE